MAGLTSLVRHDDRWADAHAPVAQGTAIRAQFRRHPADGRRGTVELDHLQRRDGRSPGTAVKRDASRPRDRRSHGALRAERPARDRMGRIEAWSRVWRLPIRDGQQADAERRMARPRRAEDRAGLHPRSRPLGRRSAVGRSASRRSRGPSPVRGPLRLRGLSGTPSLTQRFFLLVVQFVLVTSSPSLALVAMLSTSTSSSWARQSSSSS